MSTVFTKIIDGELPGRFLWRDEQCVSFLSINPIRRGHALVVPIEEVDHWVDLDPDLAAHLMVVSRHIGRAQMRAFRPGRIGLIIAGFEVPHTHLHTIPVDGMGDFDFALAAANPDAADLDDVAARIRAELTADGHPGASPG